MIQSFGCLRSSYAAPAEVAQGGAEHVTGAALHPVADANEPSAAVAFLQLAVQQGGIDGPVAASIGGDPAAEVGGQGVEVEAQAVSDDHRDAGRSHGGGQGMGRLLGSWPECEGQPEPGHPVAGAGADADLIQLEMRQVQAAKEVAVPQRAVALLPHAWHRMSWIRSLRPWWPSATSAWTWVSGTLRHGQPACRQAWPWVGVRRGGTYPRTRDEPLPLPLPGMRVPPANSAHNRRGSWLASAGGGAAGTSVHRSTYADGSSPRRAR